MAVVVLGAVTGPFLAHHTQPDLPNLLAGLLLMWCGTDLCGAAATRRQGWLLCAAGTTWFLPDLGVTGFRLLDSVLVSIVLVHVPLLVAAVELAPLGNLSRLPSRLAVAVAAASAASAVTGGHAVLLGLTGTALVAAAGSSWRRAGRPRTRTWAAYLGAAGGYGAVLTTSSLLRLTDSGPGDAVIATVYAMVAGATAILLVAVGPWLRREYAVDVGPDGLAALDGLGLPSEASGDRRTGLLVREGLELVARNRELRAAAVGRVRDLEALRLRLVTVESEERQALVARLSAGPLERLARIQVDLESAGVPDQLVQSVQRTRDELRALAEGLDPFATSGSLATSVDALIRRAAIPVQATCEPVDVDPEVGRALWFACAEALSNAAKHAPGSRVHVSLTGADGAAVIAVSDDGPGGADPDGAGLRGVADRVAAIGGRVNLSSGTHGTTLRFWAPARSRAEQPPDGSCHHVPRTRDGLDVDVLSPSLASMTPTTEVSS